MHQFAWVGCCSAQTFVEEKDPLLEELSTVAAAAAPPAAVVVQDPTPELSSEVQAAAALAELEHAPRSAAHVLAAVSVAVQVSVDLIAQPLFRLSDRDLACLQCTALFEKALERDFNLVLA